MSNHLSRLALDRVLANVAAGPDLLHLRDCERCAARLALLQQDDNAFLTRFPTMEALERDRPPERPAPAPERKLSIGWPLSVAGALVAALLLLSVIPRGAPPVPSRGGVRTKGASIVEVAVRRGNRSLLYEDGLELLAGDVLAFRYTTRRRHLLLLSVEGSGKVNAYLTDPSRRQSMQIRPGHNVRLGLGVELDDYVGPERVIALLSDEPLDVEAVRQAVQQRFRALSGDARERLELGELPVDAEQISWLIDKGGRWP
jgi:hypothetical protein